MNNNENETEKQKTEDLPQKSDKNIWYQILWDGLGETFIKVGSIIVTILLCGVVLVFASLNYLKERKTEESEIAPVENTVEDTDAELPYFSPSVPSDEKSHTTALGILFSSLPSAYNVMLFSVSFANPDCSSVL